VPVQPFRRLIVSRDFSAAIVAQARAEAPLECCGLLAGRIRDDAAIVEARYPLVNEAASPVEFVSEARSMFAATREMDRLGLKLLAIYHSHPGAPPVPSTTDLARNYSPDVVNIIVSLQTEPPVLRGWWLTDTEYLPAMIDAEWK
jgi:proteasome lid subunit RPN8/RPN11